MLVAAAFGNHHAEIAGASPVRVFEESGRVATLTADSPPGVRDRQPDRQTPIPLHLWFDELLVLDLCPGYILIITNSEAPRLRSRRRRFNILHASRSPIRRNPKSFAT